MSFTIHPESAPVLTDRIAFWDWPTRIDRKEVYIDQILQAVCGRGWVDEEDRYWLHLCLEEVVVNAMLHGNEGDPDLRVRVGIYRDEGDWVILIRDQGRGFTPSAVPDANDPESLLLEHGRGILLMGEWLDRLCYYAGGSVACLRRRITIWGGDSMPSAFVQVQVYKKNVLIEITKDRILDAATINEIAAAIQEVLDRVPKISLVLDLSKVTAMSSQMLGKLVAVHKEVKKGKGRLAVAGVAASMKQLFKITKLDKMLDMHDDPQKVLMTYQRKPL